MLHPPLSVGDGPGVSRGDTGEGVGTRSTSLDGWDMSTELEETHVRVDGVGSERAAEDGQ
jgi:hypothetical protein